MRSTSPYLLPPAHTLSTLAVGALLTSLVEGCISSSTDDCAPSTFENTRDVVVTAEHAALVADGEASELDCKLICGDSEDRQFIECYDLRPADSTGAGAGGAGGGSGGAGMQVTCVSEDTAYCEGRRHAGVVSDARGRGPTYVAAWLSRAARAEAASVLSFRALAGELRRWGAPDALVARALEAAREEARHARVVGRLAKEAGGEAARPRRARTSPRTLFEIALENAVEGCVHETFAAVIALHQARFATAVPVRDAMNAIARDEVGHAELAWAIHAWVVESLGADDRAAIERAMSEALANLEAAVAEETTPAGARAQLGLPDTGRAVSLAAGLRHGLLAPAVVGRQPCRPSVSPS